MPDTESMMSLVRLRVREGALPAQVEVTTTLGGSSAGSQCAVCSEPVTTGAAEIELVWTGQSGRRTVLLHPSCHAAWLAVARQPESLSS